jgi:hypothetical protein
MQADGVAPLPARAPGAPLPKPTAAELRALRKAAIADGVESAVLAYASSLVREEARDDEDAIRAALGSLDGYALGHGVLRDLGVREAKPKTQRGDPPPKPRQASAPIPMEHAWRIEALVDGAKVQAALERAGLAFTAAVDPASSALVVLEAPYDAAGLAALRSHLEALGALSAVPRRFQAQAIALSVRGLGAEAVRDRLAAQPPEGFTAVATLVDGTPPSVRVRLSPR